MGGWVNHEESLFFICFCFIGVLECIGSVSVACVFCKCVRFIRSRTCIICTHVDCTICEASTFFSVLLEATALVHLRTVYSLWTDPPNTSSSEHHFTCLCQLLALVQWHCASVPCFHGLVYFSSLVVTISHHIPWVDFTLTSCFWWPAVKTIRKGYL